MQIANRDIESIYGALSALASRRLTTNDSVKKVATLLRKYFEAPHRIYSDMHNAIVRDHPAPGDWEGDRPPTVVEEARLAAIDALLNETQDIGEIPTHLFLTEADMPKPIAKGELADQNQLGVAGIQHRLGFLFPLDDDEPDEAAA